MTHRIRSVWGYHGNEIGRYDVLTNGNRLFTPNVLALTNTRYVLGDMNELPFINASLVAGPVKDASGNTLYLYRINSANPYAWVTPVAVKASDDASLATLLDPRFDVRRAALFDEAADVNVAKEVQSLPMPLGIPAKVSHYEAGSVRIDLGSPAPAGSSLVVSENYYPGWLATVDGKPAHIGRADYTLIGVELPAGARQVALQFTSPSYQKGKLITWIAILVAALALLAGLWVDRRDRRGLA
jgi:hypothetical protein